MLYLHFFYTKSDIFFRIKSEKVIDKQTYIAYNIDEVTEPAKTVLIEVMKPNKIMLIEVTKPTKIVLMATSVSV